MNDVKKSAKTKKIAKNITFYVLVSLLALLFVFPLIWMISTSTKTEVKFNLDRGSLLTFIPDFASPKTFFGNYKSVLTEYGIWRNALNSFFYCAVVMVGCVLVNALAGYVLAKFDFPGKGFVSFMILFLIVVPVETTIIPLFSIVFELKLDGTIFAVLLPPLISIFNIFLFRQFFEGIPKEYEEAASIDGASSLRIFFSVIIPMSKPIVATVATFAFIGTWNDYVWPTMVLPSPLAGEWDWLPIQAAITSIEARNPTTGEMMSALVITSIPIFLVYTFAQKYIVQGFGASGLKM